MKKILTITFLLTSLFFANALAEGPVIEESSGFYSNGKIKYKVFTYRDNTGHEIKTVRQTYRKNGSRRYDSVVEDGRILYFGKYSGEGLPKVQKIYKYNFAGVLISIETKRDGESSFQIFETDASGQPVDNE